jgi:hypothetical protein
MTFTFELSPASRGRKPGQGKSMRSNRANDAWKQALVEALLRANPSLELFQYNYEKIAQHQGCTVAEAKAGVRAIHLNGPGSGSGLKITLEDDRASIAIPLGHKKRKAKVVFEEIWQCLQTIAAETGYEIHDPQTGKAVRSREDFEESFACYTEAPDLDLSAHGNAPPFKKRCFPIRRDGSICTGFYTGTCRDEAQILMGLYCPDVVCFFFSPSGKLLHEEARRWDVPAPKRYGGHWDTDDPDFRRALERQLQRWQEEIGAAPATVRVKAFFSESRTIGITDGLDMFLTEEDEGNEDILAEEAQNRKDWIDNGYFVFNWAKDFHMWANGSVMSS